MADEVVARLSNPRQARESGVRLAPGGRIRRSATPGMLSGAAGPDGGQLDSVTESTIRSSGGGRPLDVETRSRIEPAFGTDFSDVRIHADSKAAPMIGATAFTLGNDIHFAPNAYEPGSAAGQHVLAHELTHVVQQGNTARRQPTIRRLGSAPRLADINVDYDTEQTDTGHYDFPIVSLADTVRRTKTCKDMLEAASELNPAEVERAKRWLEKDPQQTADLCNPAVNSCHAAAIKLLALILPMSRQDAYNKIKSMYDINLEVARRSEIVIQDDGTLDRAALATRKVAYDNTPDAQAASVVTIAGKKLKRSATYASPNADVDTADSVSFHSGSGWEVFVVGSGGDLHMASHKIGKFHHSSLLGGGAVSFAGELKVASGKVMVMSNKSGHYRPTVDMFLHYLKSVKAQGLDLDFKVVRLGEKLDNKTGEELLSEVELADETGAAPVISTTQAPGKAAVNTPLTAPDKQAAEVAWHSYTADGKNPHAYLVGAPPDGLGWRSLPGNVGFEREFGSDIAGPVIWAKVSHEEIRVALEQKWGPAKKVARKRFDDNDLSKDQFRWT